MSDKKELVAKLLDSMSPDAKALVLLNIASEALQEKYRMSQWAHSGDHRWVQLSSDNVESNRSFSLEVFLNDSNEVRVRAICMPLKNSMTKMELGDFSYPNPNFHRQVTKFRDMIEVIRDELGD